ncbi:MAG TPA: hypothetical protein VFS21_24950 [Roseiflexaceae bacterium]|nr:hypothetical protein [Roseiflexaceae bacterium]
MPITDADINQISAIIEPLIGQKAWNVALGVGSFVTIDFGNVVPSKRPGGRSYGEWYLWMYCCAWYMSKDDDIVVGSEDERETISAHIHIVSGLELVKVTIKPPAFEATFNFADGVALHLFPVFSTEYEHWMLYTPHNNVLTLGPGSTWSYAPSAG